VNVPTLPGFFPIAASGRVIYRTYLGISAVNVSEIRDNNGKVIAKPGEIDWKSTDFEASLAVLLSDLKMSSTVNTWLTQVYSQSATLHLEGHFLRHPVTRTRPLRQPTSDAP